MNDGSTAERGSVDLISAALVFTIAYAITYLMSSRFKEVCPLLAAASVATLAALPFLIT